MCSKFVYMHTHSSSNSLSFLQIQMLRVGECVGSTTHIKLENDSHMNGFHQTHPPTLSLLSPPANPPVLPRKSMFKRPNPRIVVVVVVVLHDDEILSTHVNGWSMKEEEGCPHLLFLHQEPNNTVCLDPRYDLAEYSCTPSHQSQLPLLSSLVTLSQIRLAENIHSFIWSDWEYRK